MTDNVLTFSPKERAELKAQAHGLNPVVLIGDKGLTNAVLKEIELALSAHGLIKVRVAGDDREVRAQYAQEICEATQCGLVQLIGKLIVLYRPLPEDSSANAAPIKRKPREKRLTKRQFNSKD